MATPSFEELLDQARAIARTRSEAQDFPHGQAIASGVSSFVSNLLKEFEQKPTTHFVTKEGEVNPYAQPRFENVGLLGSLFKRQSTRTMEEGIPISGEKAGEFYTTKALLREKVRLKPGPFGTQSALRSGFAREEELISLFPEIPRDQLYTPPVSEVSHRRLVKAQNLQGIAPKSLTPEQVKVIGNVDQGVQAIDRMLLLLEKRPEIFRKGSFDWNLLNKIATAGDVEAQAFVRDRYIVSDVITRLRTGAALNQQEQEFYPGLISTIFSSEEIVPENLNILKDFYTQVSYEIKAGIRIPGVMPEESSTFKTFRKTEISPQPKSKFSSAEEILNKYLPGKQ